MPSSLTREWPERATIGRWIKFAALGAVRVPLVFGLIAISRKTQDAGYAAFQKMRSRAPSDLQGILTSLVFGLAFTEKTFISFGQCN